MEYTNKILALCILLISLTYCNSQEGVSNNKSNLVGAWIVVHHDYRGYQKLNIEQANEINNSVLYIKKGLIYYDNINFIDTCKFAELLINKFDTTFIYGYSFERKYTKKELADLIVIKPVNSTGSFSCYNECSKFFMKQDTLINICGGYTFYLIKSSLDKVNNK